jgi:hypothetical protein
VDNEITYDVKSLIGRFGGPQAFRTACVAAGCRMPKYTAVRQWVSRNSAPGHMVGLMMYVAAKQWGPTFQPLAYVTMHVTDEAQTEDAA